MHPDLQSTFGTLYRLLIKILGGYKKATFETVSVLGCKSKNCLVKGQTIRNYCKTILLQIFNKFLVTSKQACLLRSVS